MTTPIVEPITPADAGCWVPGWLGYNVPTAFVTLARRHGYPLSVDDLALIDRRVEGLDDPADDRESEDLLWLAEHAMDWLNDHAVPEGFAFEWRDGEVFLSPTDEMEQA